MTTIEEAQQLINSPQESLAVEIKQWLDITEKTNIAKIVKSSLAIRNFNGGHLLIGFNNDTLNPDTDNTPTDIEEKFHIDIIQGLITKYSSEAFEVNVNFPEKDGIVYPVISIPPGVQNPVACKADLEDNGNKLLKQNDVYFRTLNANNTPSSAKIHHKDWSKISQICFDNREADIGRFFRRHLSGLNLQNIQTIINFLGIQNQNDEEDEDFAASVLDFLELSNRRFETVVQEKNLDLPPLGFWDVAAGIDGEMEDQQANLHFLRTATSNNPRHTGWPLWLNSEGHNNEESYPYVHEEVWEEFLNNLGQGDWAHLDFIRFNPRGLFYQRRALEDDTSLNLRNPTPMQKLDFVLPIARVAESISVLINMAKALGCNESDTNLHIVYRWSKLNGRILSSWANPGRYISEYRRPYRDVVTSEITVPLDTAPTAYGNFVKQAVDPLFEIFDGFVLSQENFDQITNQTISKRF
jgi:hypothetical protein